MPLLMVRTVDDPDRFMLSPVMPKSVVCNWLMVTLLVRLIVKRLKLTTAISVVLPPLPGYPVSGSQLAAVVQLLFSPRPVQV